MHQELDGGRATERVVLEPRARVRRRAQQDEITSSLDGRRSEAAGVEQQGPTTRKEQNPVPVGAAHERPDGAAAAGDGHDLDGVRKAQAQLCPILERNGLAGDEGLTGPERARRGPGVDRADPRAPVGVVVRAKRHVLPREGRAVDVHVAVRGPADPQVVTEVDVYQPIGAVFVPPLQVHAAASGQGAFEVRQAA